MRIMSMNIKCSDQFYCNIEGPNGFLVQDYQGYVPDFMPDDHYGDYIILDIDLDTGKIVNWRKDIKTQVAQFINDCKDGNTP